MKGKIVLRKRIIAIFMLVVLVCQVPCAALELENRASDQIASYTTIVDAIGDGEIEIYFDIQGTLVMDAIGAEEIVVYRLSGSNWVEVGYYDRDDAGMSSENESRHNDSVYFYGTEGVRYKVVIELFAEDSRGYDSRTRTHYVTA